MKAIETRSSRHRLLNFHANFMNSCICEGFSKLIQVLSNDKLKSVDHRVVAKNMLSEGFCGMLFAGHATTVSPKPFGLIKDLISDESTCLQRFSGE